MLICGNFNDCAHVTHILLYNLIGRVFPSNQAVFIKPKGLTISKIISDIVKILKRSIGRILVTLDLSQKILLRTLL